MHISIETYTGHEDHMIDKVTVIADGITQSRRLLAMVIPKDDLPTAKADTGNCTLSKAIALLRGMSRSQGATANGVSNCQNVANLLECLETGASKIHIIKNIRAVGGMGLYEAKQLTDNYLST